MADLTKSYRKPAMQNTSHAVMAQRHEPKNSADDFPTPPWATRALLTHVIGPAEDLRTKTCLEPACGAGHMSEVLAESFDSVTSSDLYDYGYGEIRDFLDDTWKPQTYDWVITNPPFRLAEEFVRKSLAVAHIGVAVLARTVFIESLGRYERLFTKSSPTTVAPFVERVPMVRGRLDETASTATAYAWFVWHVGASGDTKLSLIPPCRKELERSGDYDAPAPPSRRAQK